MALKNEIGQMNNINVDKWHEDGLKLWQQQGKSQIQLL